MTTLAEVHIAITAGVADDNLDALFEAIKTRKKILVSLKALEFKKGINVRIINIRPKYLEGLEGEIVSQSNTKWIVRLNANDLLEAGSYAINGTLKLHAACIEVI